MRTRTIKKNFWLNENENRKLKSLSSLLNLSEADVIRKILFETKVKESPPKEFYTAIEKINKIGVNINQLTKIANATNMIYEYKLNKQFRELNQFIDNIIERYL